MELLSPRTLAALAALTVGACVPNTDVDESRIEGPRVLAVTSEPAEARDGQVVTYSALFVDQNGLREDGVLAWFQCSARLPLSELSPISKVCLDPDSDANQSFGRGPSSKVALPRDACALFGPNAPTPKPGEPAQRPVDPDATGGYKVPILLGVGTDQGEDLVVYEQRLACNLSGAELAVSTEFRTRYRNNQNPAIQRLLVRHEDGREDVPGEGERVALAAGEKVRIEARVPACPAEDACGDGVCGLDETRAECPDDCTTPVGCGGAETFLRYDTSTRKLEEDREALRFAWYSTSGQLGEERTGIPDDSSSRTSGNDYTASRAPGSASLFVVVRDTRGGVGHLELRVDVE